MKVRTFAWLYSSDGTVADSELQPMFQRPAPLAAILLLPAGVLLVRYKIEKRIQIILIDINDKMT